MIFTWYIIRRPFFEYNKIFGVSLRTIKEVSQQEAQIIIVIILQLLGVVLDFEGCRRLNRFDGYSIFSPRNPSVARKIAEIYGQR